MFEVHIPLLATALIFIVAGIVKGVTGMGLPTVAVGLLGLLMGPAEASALLVIPSLVTNVWQFAAGPHRGRTLRQLWPMLLAIGLVTFASAPLITRNAAQAAAALGLALCLYACLGLAKMRITVPRRHESWLSPAIGALTGLVTGATGVFAIPAVPYLQALGLRKDELVQALGLSFTVSTIALALGLARIGVFHLSAAGLSVACTAPALAGMVLGQWIRAAVNPETFRLIFCLGLLVLGAELMLRSYG